MHNSIQKQGSVLSKECIRQTRSKAGIKWRKHTLSRSNAGFLVILVNSAYFIQLIYFGLMCMLNHWYFGARVRFSVHGVFFWHSYNFRIQNTYTEKKQQSIGLFTKYHFSSHVLDLMDKSWFSFSNMAIDIKTYFCVFRFLKEYELTKKIHHGSKIASLHLTVCGLNSVINEHRIKSRVVLKLSNITF